MVNIQERVFGVIDAFSYLARNGSFVSSVMINFDVVQCFGVKKFIKDSFTYRRKSWSPRTSKSTLPFCVCCGV
jgi:hypothetical protein